MGNFIAGTLAGAILCFLVVAIVGIRNLKKEADERKRRQEKLEQDAAIRSLEDVTTELQRIQRDSTLAQLLQKAMDITSRQSKIDLRGGEEQVLLYNNLELEKLALLKTILKGGQDPVITVRFSTGDQQMNLSSYVASIQKNLN